MRLVPVRSRTLLALSLALLAASGALAMLLHHDGEVGTGSLAETRSGEHVRFKAELAPVVLSRDGAWDVVASALDNHTSIAIEPVDGAVVLVTTPWPHLARGTAVVEGTVVLTQAHPGEPTVRIVVVQATSITTPIVFR